MEWLWRLLRLDEDSLREQRIEKYRRLMECSLSRVQRRVWSDLMHEEIAQRSRRQLARMHRTRGLA